MNEKKSKERTKQSVSKTPYEKPVLIKFGTIVGLTAGSGSTTPDGEGTFMNISGH